MSAAEIPDRLQQLIPGIRLDRGWARLRPRIHALERDPRNDGHRRRLWHRVFLFFLNKTLRRRSGDRRFQRRAVSEPKVRRAVHMVNVIVVVVVIGTVVIDVIVIGIYSVVVVRDANDRGVAFDGWYRAIGTAYIVAESRRGDVRLGETVLFGCDYLLLGPFKVLRQTVVRVAYGWLRT